jgi:predicted ATPase with chaperone activity
LRSNVRISGPRLRGRPLLDRIDIHMEVPRVAYDKLAHATRGEPSKTIHSVSTRCFKLSPALG